MLILFRVDCVMCMSGCVLCRCFLFFFMSGIKREITQQQTRRQAEEEEEEEENKKRHCG